MTSLPAEQTLGLGEAEAGPAPPLPASRGASPVTAWGMTVTSRRWLRSFTPWSGSCILTTTRSIWAKEVEGLARPASPAPRTGFPGTDRDEPHQCAWKGLVHWWWDFRPRRIAEAREGAQARGDPAPGSPPPRPGSLGAIAPDPRPPRRARVASTFARTRTHASLAPPGSRAGKPGEQAGPPAPTLLRCGLCVRGCPPGDAGPAAMAMRAGRGRGVRAAPPRPPPRPAPPRPGLNPPRPPGLGCGAARAPDPPPRGSPPAPERPKPLPPGPCLGLRKGAWTHPSSVGGVRDSGSAGMGGEAWD